MKIEQGQLLYPKIFPLFSQDISHKDHQWLKFAQVWTRSNHFLNINAPNQGFDFHKGDWIYNATKDFHGSLWVSKNTHANFQVLDHNFAQSIDQMTENQLYWVKSQLWSTYSQNSIFFTNINILKYYASFYQLLITISQEKHLIYQKGKMVKIKVLTEKGQFLIFDLANGHLV